MLVCIAAAPLMLIAGAMSAAGTVAGGISANNQSKYDAKVAQNNSRLAVEQARESEKAGVKERRDYWRDVAQQKGQAVAAMAANGVDVDFGTPARSQTDTKTLSREDADALYKNQANRTRGFVIDANNYVAEAKASKARGKSALIGSIFQGASTLIGSAAQYKAMRAKAGG